jgi:predicted RNA-binding Zn ribbon-like protein
MTKRSNSIRSGRSPSESVGERAAIEFANSTRLATDSTSGQEPSWAALISSLAAVGNFSDSRTAALLGLEVSAPEATAALLNTALDLRDAIRRTLRARVDGRPLEPVWIGQVNSILAFTEGYDRLEPVAESVRGAADWRLGLAARSEGLEWLLAAIARSAADLIVEGPGAPIRRCANPKCGLYFYDNSRTGRRRWCSMATCGNRAKVAAHSRRKRNAKSAM